MSDQFIRTRLLVGDEPLDRLKKAKVAVVTFQLFHISSFLVVGVQFAGEQRLQPDAQNP